MRGGWWNNIRAPAHEPIERHMRIARYLYSESSKTVYLLVGSGLILLLMLGSGVLWNLETRWAAIAMEMMRSGDYFHPYYFTEAYFDKPLLSYWLITGFGHLFGQLNEWALRLPSALAGLLAVWCTYRLGAKLFSRETGLLAGWMLATCFFFVFWARVASADILNLAGTIAAVAWYFERKDRPGFISYSVFFLILAVTCLTKGLIAAVIAILVIIPDLLRNGNWKQYANGQLVLAAILAIAVYFVPFVLSDIRGGANYPQSGLGMVFRENVVRFFHPFDHKGPIYTYLIYFPLYSLPWSIFLPSVLWRAWREWKTLEWMSRWALWACLLIFLFLTASGSRRSYYILLILPFAVLMIADWIMAAPSWLAARRTAVGWLTILAGSLLLIWYGVAIPHGASMGGARLMAREVRAVAERQAPWNQWRIGFCDDSRRLAFYYNSLLGIKDCNPQNEIVLQEMIRSHPRTILVTEMQHYDEVKRIYPRSITVIEQSRLPHFLSKLKSDQHVFVAFIPQL
jgi:4-amino-4-deoxy-L-arabinose transferase-like glycosyltransferase